MAKFKFTVQHTDGAARRGTVQTPHGNIETPAFVPVGTQATVKTLDVADLEALDAQILLANTYHLYLRPGADTIAQLGGLHGFMGFSGPIITDSGGFQVFSLGFGLEHGVSKISNIFPDEDSAQGGSVTPSAERTARPKLMTVDEEGVSFRSHLDGSSHRMTPEDSIGIQQQLGADIILAFDECTSPLHEHAYTAAALKRTHAWAERSLAAWTNRPAQALFGIVQGGAYRDLREQSARFIDQRDFPGVAIGGSLGKSKADMHRILEWSVPLLAPAKPRHLLGIGDVTDLFACVARGIDLFDCVAPTRLARHGTVYLSPRNGGRPANGFRLNVSAARESRSAGPIDPGCHCPTCTSHSRGYLRHLFNANEQLGPRLATVHNLHFMLELMRQIRAAVADGRLEQLAKVWCVA